MERIADALNRAHDAAKDCNDVISTLELTAGQGSSIGHRFEHIRAIMDRVENKDRIGACIDTAHIFAAGYERFARIPNVLETPKGPELIEDVANLKLLRSVVSGG